MRILVLVLLMMCGTSHADPPLRVVFEDGMGPESRSFSGDRPQAPVGGYHKGIETTLTEGPMAGQVRVQLMNKNRKPSDFKGKFNRGTVEYHPKLRNYSWCKVIVPDGTIIHKTNFTQRFPRTKAIYGKNLVLVDCNLQNNLIDPTWTVISCRTVQSDINIQFDPDMGEMVMVEDQATGNEFDHKAAHPNLVPMDHITRTNPNFRDTVDEGPDWP